MPHTPEPWIDDDGLVTGRDSRERFKGTCSCDLFNAHEWPDELFDEAMSNARLIAAAPGMLTVLKKVRDFFRLPACDQKIVFNTVESDVIHSILKAEAP